MGGLRIGVLSRASQWGLLQDSKIVEQVLRECSAGGYATVDSVEHLDPVMFYGKKVKAVDIFIHLEVPCRAAFSWAKMNIVVVNPEWWPTDAWNWVFAEKGGADLILFKSEHARSLFPEIDAKRARVVRWRTAPAIQHALSSLPKTPQRREFLFLIGASANKLAAARTILTAWKPTWPPMLAVGDTEVVAQLKTLTVAPNIQIREPFHLESDRIRAQVEYAFHIVASEAEGFGYTFAEAAAVGAIPLWTRIPVYEELWGSVVKNVGQIQMNRPTTRKYRDTFQTIDAASLESAVSSILSLSSEDEAFLRGALRHAATTRITEFRSGWRNIMKSATTKVNKTSAVSLPPTSLSDFPSVAVITITRNRPRWFPNMAQNILKSNYPPDKLTWVIADDGEGAGRVDEAVMKFQSANPYIRVKYVSLPKRLAVGAKRNKACEEAPAEATVFVMMDDDDHYPAGSIAGRIAWMRAMGKECVACATLPMYHCTKYISAINVPPLGLSPAERVSEATLCFTRKFWEARKFPGPVNVAEGEGFLAGRETEVGEIGPEGIIVSFLHGGNSTSRRIPADSEPNGCHYGFSDEFFSYLAGME